MVRRVAMMAAVVALCTGGAAALEINDGGPRQAGESEAGVAYARDIDLVTGNVDYRLAVQYVEADAGETFVRAIGLLARTPGRHFSKRGWYAGGFIQVDLGDLGLFDSPATIAVGDRGVSFTFATEQGEAVLRLETEAQSEILFVTLALPRSHGGARVTLTAYPGDYNKGEYEKNDRWVATATREVRHGESVAADASEPVELVPAREPWVYCFDRRNNPAGNAWLSTNAVLLNPSEVSGARVRIGNYAVRVSLDYPAGIGAAHLMLWEFPGADHDQVLRYMRGLVVEVIEEPGVALGRHRSPTAGRRPRPAPRR